MADRSPFRNPDLAPWVERHPFVIGQKVSDGTHLFTVVMRGEDALGLWFAAAEQHGRFPVSGFVPHDPPPPPADSVAGGGAPSPAAPSSAGEGATDLEYEEVA